MTITNVYRSNPKLKSEGVSLSLTEEQISEYIKCSKDPIYFITHYVQIVTLDGGLQLFKLWPFQKKLVNLMHNNRFVIAKILRQAGKTTTVLAYFLWITLFTERQNILIAANKRQVAEDILGKYQIAYENIPLWMQQGVVQWNKGNIELENGSKIRASSTTSGAARSGSYNCVVGDTMIKCKISGIETEKSIIDLLGLINKDEQIHLIKDQKMNNNLFLPNKYYKWYMDLVTSAQQRNWTKDIAPCYVEKHHIIPKSLNGTNHKNNLVCLTAREHFVAHKLLVKCTTGKNKAKMVSALWMMLASDNKQRFLSIPSYEYEKIRIQLKIFMSGENNPRFGKPGTGKSGPLHPAFGIKRSKEFCENLSKKLKGHKKSEEWINKINRNPEKIAKIGRQTSRDETVR